MKEDDFFMEIATANDIPGILEISADVYSGNDYLPHVIRRWIKIGQENPGLRSNFGEKIEISKTGVINDPLGQPTVTAGSDFHLMLKFWDGLMFGDGRTDNMCENSDHYRPGLWVGLVN